MGAGYLELPSHLLLLTLGDALSQSRAHTPRKSFHLYQVLVPTLSKPDG